MSLETVLRPAISLAREGFPVTEVTQFAWDIGKCTARKFQCHEIYELNALIDDNAVRNCSQLLQISHNSATTEWNITKFVFFILYCLFCSQ